MNNVIQLKKKEPTIGYQACFAELNEAVDYLSKWEELPEISLMVQRLKSELELLEELHK